MILSAGHKEQIRETLCKASLLADTASIERLRECYAEDCAIEPDGGPPVVGIDAIKGFIQAATANGINWRHITSNHVIAASGEAVCAWSSIVLLMLQNGKFEVAMAGFYEDRMVMDGNAWKIQQRKIRTQPATLKLWPDLI